MTVQADYWVTRGGKWHRVESQIEDRLVTRCGRQLRLTIPGPYGDRSLISSSKLDPADRACRYCR